MGNVVSGIKQWGENLGQVFGWGAKNVLTPLNYGIGKIGSVLPSTYGQAVSGFSAQAQSWIDRLGGLYSPDERMNSMMPRRQFNPVPADFGTRAQREVIGAELQKSFQEQSKMIGQPITSREDIARIQEQRRIIRN